MGWNPRPNGQDGEIPHCKVHGNRARRHTYIPAIDLTSDKIVWGFVPTNQSVRQYLSATVP